MRFDQKRKAVLERIKYRTQAIVRAKEYLEFGRHANWVGFRPLFAAKLKDGEELPPHRDWVKNVFLPNAERSLKLDEKALERLDEKQGSKR